MRDANDKRVRALDFTDICKQVHACNKVTMDKEDKLIFCISGSTAIEGMLETEIISEFNRQGVLSKDVRAKIRRDEVRNRNVEEAAVRLTTMHANWPNVIPNETIMACCRDYYNATLWSPPPVCAACSRTVGSMDHFDEVTEVGAQAHVIWSYCA
jgi:hypothetical protein